MDQLDRRTKLLIVGGVFLLLVIGIIVLAVSCNAARQKGAGTHACGRY